MGGEEWRVTTNGYEVLGERGQNVLKLRSNDRCTTLEIYEKAPLNYTLLKGKFYSM